MKNMGRRMPSSSGLLNGRREALKNEAYSYKCSIIHKEKHCGWGRETNTYEKWGGHTVYKAGFYSTEKEESMAFSGTEENRTLNINMMTCVLDTL